MPPYRRWYRWRRKRRYPRRRFWTWGPRQTFRRRRVWRRRRRRVRKPRKFYRKLTKITLKQFQPNSIRNCTVKGFKCLLQCGKDRESNNYAQYILSYTPEHWPGGGGWSMMVFSLGSLYEDHTHLMNIFTASNAGLNLVRFVSSKFTFYQHQNVDYVVVPRTCYPMTDGPLDHPNAQPYRALLEHKKIIIPSIDTKPLRKRCRKVTFRPPAEFTNRWYFQRHVCNKPFLLLTTSACSLRNMYINPSSSSNNITLTSLNTNLFQNHNFQDPSATTGYQPKNNMYLWSLGNGDETPTDKNKLIRLGNTKDDRQGVVIKDSSQNKMDNWGNPFNSYYMHPDVRIFYSSKNWDQLQNTSLSTDLQELGNPLYVKCRYNPDKDTGEGNEVYWVKNFTGTDWQTPENFTLKIDGLPLWCALWGWADWIKKTRDLTRVDQDHIMVIKSTFFDTTLPAYVFLDDSMRTGKGPYDSEQSNYLKTHWHPQFQLQQVSINTLATSGPATPKPPYKTSFEAHCRYKIRFKWGGCPSTIEKIYDPCNQQIYPLPDPQLQTLQIENPETPIEAGLYDFDVRRDIITKKAADRITKYKETKTDIQTFETGPRSLSSNLATKTPQTLQEELQTDTSDSEEEKAPIQLQLRHQRRKQRQLKQRILQLLNPHLE